MRKELQTFLYRVSFLCLIIISMAVGYAFAQVEMTGEGSYDVRFTKDQTQIQGSSIVISLSQLHQFISLENRLQASEWRHYGENDEIDSGIYLEDGPQFVSPGRIQLTETDEKTFFAISFSNKSEVQFSSTVVAFDFKYHHQNILRNYRLSLHYKVNDENWRMAEGGIIQTSSLGASESDEWESFSTQLNIDDIYLRENDEIHLKWVFEGSDDIEPNLSLVLQGVEMTPVKSTVPELERGALIITEILPSVAVDGTDFEYVELYNPSQKPVPLKGLEIVSSGNSRVIQRDVEIPPYSLFVLSNVDISGFDGVRYSYSYDGSVITSSAGRIELIQYNNVLASAAYEIQEPGIALQLDRALSAYDGYTSLQNLRPAEESFYPDLAGSPGNFATTVPLYKKTIERSGWYLMAPPGRLVARLNRLSAVRFYTLNMEPVSVDQIEPFETIFVHKENNTPVTLFVEAVIRPGGSSSIEMTRPARHINLGSFRTPDITSLNRVVKGNDEQLAPVLNVWNENRQKFEPGFVNEISLNNWTPFSYNQSVSDRLDVDRGGTSSEGVYLERFIPFRLYDGSGNNKVLQDEAILGFMSHTVQREERRYDLPRLVTHFAEDDAPLRESVLYLSSQEAEAPANSFIHFPFDPAEARRAGIGYQFSSSGGNASLEWDLRNDIPDEWVLTLEDTHTGNAVNMREVSSYRFRYNSEVSEEGQDKKAGLSVFEPTARNRFVVAIEPFEAIPEEETEEQRSGSVELRQNYPNPFNPATNITFYLPEDRAVKVGIYNIVGQQVALLADETMSSGEHSIVWDAGNKPSGIYIVQLETGNRILTRKITLIK